jgi:hypothetical protein
MKLKSQNVAFFYVISSSRASSYKTIQRMKYALLFLAGLSYFALTYAQNTPSAPKQDTLKISLSNDSMSVIYKNKPLSISNMHELDSCLKKIVQGPDHPTIQVESLSDTDQEKVRALLTVLNQCHCPVLMMRMDSRRVN